jgi:hypothetical protein
VKVWRPYHRGACEIEPRIGSGRTASGLHVEIGMRPVMRTKADGTQYRPWDDPTRREKMVGEVVATYGTRQVEPGDVVLFEYGASIDVTDAEGNRHTLVSESYCTVVK